MKKLEIRTALWKSIGFMTFFGFMAVFCIFEILQEGEKVDSNVYGGAVVGILGVIGFVYVLSRGLTRTIIDERGITDWHIGFIPWEDIKDASIGSVIGPASTHMRSCVSLDVADFDKYIDQLKPFKRAFMKVNKRISGTILTGCKPITINGYGTDTTNEEALKVIVHYINKRKRNHAKRGETKHRT